MRQGKTRPIRIEIKGVMPCCLCEKPLDNAHIARGEILAFGKPGDWIVVCYNHFFLGHGPDTEQHPDQEANMERLAMVIAARQPLPHLPVCRCAHCRPDQEMK